MTSLEGKGPVNEEEVLRVTQARVDIYVDVWNGENLMNLRSFGKSNGFVIVECGTRGRRNI